MPWRLQTISAHFQLPLPVLPALQEQQDRLAVVVLAVVLVAVAVVVGSVTIIYV